MPYKFNTNDLLIRIIPGSLLIIVVFILYVDLNKISLLPKLDFLYTFIFLTLSFVFGEVLQTLVHIFEFIINIFYKGYKPSEVFIYKNNPILKNERIRKKLISKLNLKDKSKEAIEKVDYKELSFTLKKNETRKMSQGYFWYIYPVVEDSEVIKRTNINYLFTRVMMIDFFIVFLILFFSNYQTLSLLSFLLFAIFLWRARGLAKGLVFKSVLIFISNNNKDV